MTAPEFPRPHRLDKIGAGESKVTVTADEAERAALAQRFDLAQLDSLEADYTLRRDAAGVFARGKLSAKAVQRCVVTAEPLPVTIAEDFAIRFVPEPGETAGDEVELDEADCDTVFYTGGAIDLGEAAAETLALTLDPFPRGPNAASKLKEAGVLSEEEAGPFGALAALKDKLKG